ncbi:carboxypeptidase-like regulatory domain-containing protein [Chryseolinea sp. T2]|uniref:TonB-dependent receptor n=1 Tax=Chryseolinea sp. T2 TaxID=3129255 RepID=UPI003076E886
MKHFYYAILFLLMIASGTLHAQSVVSGTVIDNDTQQALPGVNIAVKGQAEGDFTSNDGAFNIKVNNFPITLVFSFIGFETQEIEVTSATSLKVTMMPASLLMQEVVVAASRTAQRKIESPVTIERFSTKDILNSPQANYYDMIQGLKGVDVTVSSIGFTSVTTRGFNTSGNTNFLQMVDGMDNQAPGLNFPLGNVLGPTQLDVDNVELLSGASSALYGSRGLNGAMIITSKDPFQHQGLSVQLNQGVNHVKNKKSNDPVDASPYTDIALRYAKRLGDKFAFKVNFQYTKAHDWVATDTTNKNGTGTRYTDPNYNGVNLYGGATSVDINPFLMYALSQDASLAPIIEPLLQKENKVARTGYPEYGYLNNNIELIKANAELRYKISPKVQAIVSGTYGTGSLVYTNDTRYQLNDFKVGQVRAELASKNWFLRAYTTLENSGNTLIAGPTAQLINEGWKVSYDGGAGGWYPEYTGALIQALAMGADINSAHLAARSYADIGRPELGSAEFNSLKQAISQKPITEGGTLFLDRSKLFNAAFQYNFSDIIKWAEIIAGVNYRMYNLDSKGTLFPDYDGPINMYEYSGYAQIIKRLLEEKLALTGSIRLDKNTLFEEAKPTLRLSSVYEVANQNYIRFSYQNAYSFPSNIQALQNTLNGTNPLSFSAGGSSYLLNGTYHFDQYAPYTLKSVEAYQESGDPADLKKYIVNDIKPQSANSFELGYAAVLGKRVLIDVLGYYATWQDFVSYTDVANTPGTQDPTAFQDPSTYVKYNIAYNNSESVNTYGYAASVNVDLTKNFMAKVNYYSDHIRNNDDEGVTRFNTPNYHINLEFGNTGFGKKKEFSFNTTLRYKPGYFYQVAGGLGQGTVPASTVIDAYVGYKVIKAHSTIKLGATNLTNKYYSTGIANPMIGGMYYISLGYNVF